MTDTLKFVFSHAVTCRLQRPSLVQLLCCSMHTLNTPVLSDECGVLQLDIGTSLQCEAFVCQTRTGGSCRGFERY